MEWLLMTLGKLASRHQGAVIAMGSCRDEGERSSGDGAGNWRPLESSRAKRGRAAAAGEGLKEGRAGELAVDNGALDLEYRDDLG
jgi:hypothetical protein